MFEFITIDAISALLQVIIIDLVLAGDNAIVIGLAAAGLPAEQRTKAILVGIGAATAMRIGLAGMTTQLLSIFGLLLAGGLLLLWVCWKMWRELRTVPEQEVETITGFHVNPDGTVVGHVRQKTLGQSVCQILVADISMSLDNVLAVAGAAREHPWVLVFGLVLSIALMGAVAGWIAQILQRYRWIAYVGLAIILFVAADMIQRGTREVWPAIKPLASLM